ncbi:hypothetical protein GUITHDRAFT_110375 [Guillardia theta CCMP2712]|uniref:Uncharacterized protein n=1 Tax=Guillardia theta (strain CCMP2712) TaxID=905079 RepID=L1J624_GUITC|nr:hypothetical protein GUITHDRAFT_110375 [Guillardia theta CCMP2712]EKX43569.1 hypothetical protein GUITHDRAFT_110375 [Guillardia theta CCMP2712]|eukprot:XP_005830549.1 hypothetical protein GUITHDRAFT_110375 [Guillardia theta CCMP2712]
MDPGSSGQQPELLDGIGRKEVDEAGRRSEIERKLELQLMAEQEVDKKTLKMPRKKKGVLSVVVRMVVMTMTISFICASCLSSPLGSDDARWRVNTTTSNISGDVRAGSSKERGMQQGTTSPAERGEENVCEESKDGGNDYIYTDDVETMRAIRRTYNTTASVNERRIVWYKDPVRKELSSASAGGGGKRSSRCIHGGCTRHAKYGMFDSVSKRRQLFCAIHRRPADEDLRSKRCQTPDGCRNPAKFGLSSQGASIQAVSCHPPTAIAQFCSKHKKKSQVLVKRNKCQFPEGCCAHSAPYYQTVFNSKVSCESLLNKTTTPADFSNGRVYNVNKKTKGAETAKKAELKQRNDGSRKGRNVTLEIQELCRAVQPELQEAPSKSKGPSMSILWYQRLSKG